MLQISAELLAMSGDAALLVRNGKVAFANASACVLLGKDCVGKPLSKVLGEDIAGVQAGSFVGEFPLSGKHYVVRACSAEGTKALFIAPVGHDVGLISDAFIFAMRNCLMSIEVSLSLLRSRSKEDSQLEHSIAVVGHEGFKINRTLNNIGIIRGAALDQLDICPVALDLGEFIKKLLETISFFIKEPAMRFTAPEGLKIYADPSLLETMLLNLISNCVLHAKGCSRISINITPGKERIFISVDDDGCGIAPELLHSVFDRYCHKFEPNEISKGPGFGLAAARTVAAMHGGTLLLESRPDIGTAVRVSLARNPYCKTALTQPVPEYELSSKNLLTGLADCLDAEYYTDKYID